MPRAFLIKNKKHPPQDTLQQPAGPGGEAGSDGWALEDRPPGDEDCYPVDEWGEDQEDRMQEGDEDDDVLDVVVDDDEEEDERLQERLQQHTLVSSMVSRYMVDSRGVDVTSIYPSPSPSSEESLCPRDDTSISSSDDEPRDVRASRNNVTRGTTPADMRRANSLSSDESPVSSPEMAWPRMTSRPLVIIPSPRTSPEPEADDDCLDRSTPSPKRRRSDGDDDMGMTSRIAHDDVTLRHQDGTAMTSSANCVPRGGVAGSRESTFWQSHLAAGMGLGLSMAVHHPYLALSFQRLQQLHLRAAQEGLPKLSPFHPHLPLAPPPPHHHHPHHPHHPGQTSPLPFAPLPPVGPPAGLQVPMPTSGSRPGSQATPSSPIQGCSSDYPFPPHARMEQQRHADFPHRTSPKHSPTGTRTVILPHVIQPTSSPSGGALESLPLDLDTKTAAEKRKRREGEPPRYNCESCGKTYSTFSGLSKHKQFHCTSHVQKQFNCKYCDKTYVSLGALKMHIRTHTLPCKCHLCGKAFSRPWLLQGHVRTHTGEKPFQCAHCGRSFADRSNLRAHLQTHSEVKKYNCRTCSKTFSRMSLLLKHEDGGCAGMAH